MRKSAKDPHLFDDNQIFGKAFMWILVRGLVFRQAGEIHASSFWYEASYLKLRLPQTRSKENHPKCNFCAVADNPYGTVKITTRVERSYSNRRRIQVLEFLELHRIPITHTPAPGRPPLRERERDIGESGRREASSPQGTDDRPILKLASISWSRSRQ
ncbi:hypothetical protein SODALDRAFT_361784 [Sodiomyces alkalinus F11]|uniref:Uncharacterized protein n=1 Tax=Sodiomyces alkalinus (strain CBS 110278 / VKM F-3762 / F11) TaxID=1314773 RepID=A0A3N2PR30_SODAK|nr:hypothetical protein SODALDRAFT_361784 [Sodiomyces alkalinus F11]ROT36945.1 hypothetical protein SODALDRAFT_361784 [Sodiomyces alkalinus F11]